MNYKIYIESVCNPLDKLADQKVLLQKLWEQSDKSHRICAKAEDADFIIACNIKGNNWFEELRTNEIISKYAEKSFAYSDGDVPLPLLRGIYPSIHTKIKFRKRFRSISYNLYPKELQNSKIISHGGNSYNAHKEYLFSFIGRSGIATRRRLLEMTQEQHFLVEDSTQEYNHFGNTSFNNKSVDRLEWYVNIMQKSKYALCPRGSGVSSLRIFEAMQMGVAPVIISDLWIPPLGLDWNSFAIFIPEAKVKSVDGILKRYEPEYIKRGRLAQEAYEEHFSDKKYFNYFISQIDDIQRKTIISERFFWNLRNIITKLWQIRIKYLTSYYHPGLEESKYVGRI